MVTASEKSLLLPSSSSSSSSPPPVVDDDDNDEIEPHSFFRKHRSEEEPDSFFQRNLWLLPVLVTLLVLIPTLLGCVIFLASLTGRLYPATICAIHMSGALICAWWQTLRSRAPPRFVISIFGIIDIYLCMYVYPGVINLLTYSFLDPDGSRVPDWINFYRGLWLLQFGLDCFVILRIIADVTVWVWDAPFCPHGRFKALDQKCFNIAKKLPSRWSEYLQNALFVVAISSLAFSCACIIFCFQYLWWQPKVIQIPVTSCCDDLDSTECSLPFPSFHHMRPDPKSRTGWRVNLQGDSLPLMKSGARMDMSFLNDLDGFSPMATILFYLDGMKETQEAEVHGFKSDIYPTLANKFEDSITNKSITLLWDVDGGELVPHTARLDYLDPHKPLIILAPSKPLNHGTHYAVAVVNATDRNGNQLQATLGMQILFSDKDTKTCSYDTARMRRFRDILLPSLREAAPWIAADDKIPNSSLQLMFDFVTMSEDSLTSVKTIRDATLEEISSWKEHNVEITKIVNGRCNEESSVLARAIHGSISVPWWLESERRDSILSPIALENKESNGVGQAKFSIYVPCSLYAAAVNDTTRPQLPMRAVVEYGHGVFSNRTEASQYSLLRVAEDQGYLIVAMDWRGMSSFDLPVILKGMLASPNLIQATRDNLIQGYACKLVMQHFAKNGLLEQEWLGFSKRGSSEISTIPIYNNSTTPLSIYYGNSQGGIFGAAYTALLGKTGLIDRAILGTPGTPFSLVLYESNEFNIYDALMTQNFYNQRHIRIAFAVIQLAWDTVEASSVLAPPVNEPYPPMLLQSGLGDPLIFHLATEALARAYNASILSNNPRKNIFGVSTANESTTPYVTWTELLYEHEFQQISSFDNIVKIRGNTTKNTLIHECVRQDCALIDQMVQFINSGRIVDPCWADQCLRTFVPCYIAGRHGNTKPAYWTCPYNTSP